MTALYFTHTHAGRKLRVHQWIDTKSLEPLFGIQANARRGVWAHIVDEESRKVVLFQTKDEAAAKITEWRAAA